MADNLIEGNVEIKHIEVECCGTCKHWMETVSTGIISGVYMGCRKNKNAFGNRAFTYVNSICERYEKIGGDKNDRIPE